MSQSINRIGDPLAVEDVGNFSMKKARNQKSIRRGWTNFLFVSISLSTLFLLTFLVPSTTATFSTRGHPPSRGPHNHGPPGPRRPPRHHPHPPPGPRPSRDMPHRLAPLKYRPPQGQRSSQVPQDLHPAAQTLYDLRGFNIPLGGQEETQRFLRQQNNDPFTRPRGFTPESNNGSPNNDPRTSPLVFPSFYQPNKHNTETTNKRPQTILNIFGHSQHLSQTKYEPAGDASHGQNNPTFRPSQVDLAYTRGYNNGFNNNNNGLSNNNNNGNNNNNNRQAGGPSGPSGPDKGELDSLQGRQVGPTPLPSQGQQILNYRSPDLQNQNQNQQNNINNNVQTVDQEPFIYVYDDEDYDEGEEEFVDKQNLINSNRVTTSSPSNRGENPTIRSGHLGIHTPTPTNPTFFRNNNNNGQSPTAKAVITSTSLPVPLAQHGSQNQNDFFPPPQQNNNNNNFFLNNNQNHRDPFFLNNQNQNHQSQNIFGQSHHQSPRPTPTPRPNVEINPSSERKPPPDQSNAVTPFLKNNANNDRFRRPTQQENQNNNNNNQFFKQNSVTQQLTQSKQQFNQVSNLEEEDDSFYDQDPEIIQKLNPYQNSQGGNRFQEPGSRLRQVNTLVPKNRIPQEDIVLPHNFPFHDDIDKTPNPNEFSSSTGTPNRGDVLRFNPRPQTVLEVTPTPQRGSLRPQQQQQQQQQQTTPPSRVRTPTRAQSYVTQSTTSEVPRTRTRGRPIRPNRPAAAAFSTTSTTTTTTTTPRPTFRTITQYSSTTPAPSYEETSDEYYDDDYNDRIVDTVEKITQKPKQSIRPVLNNQIQELHSPKLFNSNTNSNTNSKANDFEPPTSPPRRIRPTPAPEGITPFPQFPGPGTRPRQNNGGRTREQSTIESPTTSIKTTTGKPLYYAGKMLSKEGGVYAGLKGIPKNHMYGFPVPNIPFNNVFDKVPGIIENQNQGGSQRQKNHQQQQRVRARERERVEEERERNREDNKIVPSSTPSLNSRLIHPSRVRPTISHVTPSPQEFIERPQRPPQSPKFLRPQSSTSEPQSLDEEPRQPQAPRRKKIRPGQKLRQQQQQQNTRTEASHQTEEIVSIKESIKEQESLPHQQEEPKILRPNRIRPQQSSPSTEEPPASTSPLANKLRPRRPRPNQSSRTQRPTQPSIESSSLIVEEIHPTRKQQQQKQQQQQQREEQSQPQPSRKLRPRPRPKPTSQPEVSESISFVTQSSVKIARKPTESPGRFSSTFKQFQQSTSSGDDEDRPSSRPTFKPFKSSKPTEPAGELKLKRIRPQQKQTPPVNEDEEDALPASIRLSAKDVLLNRKPARRIPPGSASDRLKALQERRNNQKSISDFKRASQNNQEEDEDAVDDNRRPQAQHRTIRRRKLLATKRKKQPEQLEEEEDYNPQNDQPDLPIQNKREITQKTFQPKNNLPKEYEEEAEYNAQNEEYEDDKNQRSLQIPSNRGRTQIEVTSDEARSVVGIHRPFSSTTTRSTSTLISTSTSEGPGEETLSGGRRKQWGKDVKKQEEEYEEDDDYEGHHSHQKEIKVSTEIPPSPSVTVRKTESSSERPSSTTISYASTSTFRTPTSKNSILSNKLGKLDSSTSVVLSTSVSESSSADEGHFEDDEENEQMKELLNPASTTAASLKARLRPNKKLLASIQPRVSPSQQRVNNETKRHSNLSKLLKLKTSSSTYSPVSTSSFSSSGGGDGSSKMFTMATEDPSLPLESIFPLKKKTS